MNLAALTPMWKEEGVMDAFTNPDGSMRNARPFLSRYTHLGNHAAYGPGGFSLSRGGHIDPPADPRANHGLQALIAARPGHQIPGLKGYHVDHRSKEQSWVLDSGQRKAMSDLLNLVVMAEPLKAFHDFIRGIDDAAKKPLRTLSSLQQARLEDTTVATYRRDPHVSEGWGEQTERECAVTIQQLNSIDANSLLCVVHSLDLIKRRSDFISSLLDLTRLVGEGTIQACGRLTSTAASHVIVSIGLFLLMLNGDIDRRRPFDSSFIEAMKPFLASCKRQGFGTLPLEFLAPHVGGYAETIGVPTCRAAMTALLSANVPASLLAAVRIGDQRIFKASRMCCLAILRGWPRPRCCPSVWGSLKAATAPICPSTLTSRAKPSWGAGTPRP